MEERLECGGDDRRLLPVALALWAACLGTHLLFRWCMPLLSSRHRRGRQPTSVDGNPPEGGNVGAYPMAATGTLASLMLLALVMAVIAVLLWRVGDMCSRKGIGRGVVIVCLTASLFAAVATWSAESTVWFDPATARARDGPTRVVAGIQVVEPVEVSAMRESDCQAEARIAALDDGTVMVRSRARVRVFANGADCNRLHRGAEYRMRGELREAELGTTPLWLTIGAGEPAGGDDGDGDMVSEIARQPPFDQWRERAQEAFFHATDGLSDSGRILVPGLTMGFLGQDHMGVPEPDSTPIDATYANKLETSFRHAGIMHLMAVSGGHFVIIAALIRRLGATLLMPRQAVSCLTIACTTLMATMMAPGDSVTRALVMGWLSAAALFIGRKPQALSGLCVTAIVTLLVVPSMAWSFGFALSCAAVLGITLMAQPMARVMALLLPDALADAMAMTVAAQLATMPIQVLMEPQLPVWSVPANILVTPVVAFSTMTGLAGLAVAWVNVDAARVCVWLASWGTRIMEQVALRLGDGSQAVVPWAEGVPGAVALALVEAALIRSVVLVHHWLVPSSAGAHALLGDSFVADPRNRLRIWWADTRRMISKLAW